MRIALNARILQSPRTGIGNYLTGLVSGLAEFADMELRYFTGADWSTTLPEPVAGYSGWARAAKTLIPGAYRIRRYVEQWQFDKGLREVLPTVYHDPSLWPLEFDGPMVMTIHDLAHIRYPHTQPRDRIVEIERQTGKAVERAQRILCDSQFIADEVRSHYSLPHDKVVVAPLGCADRFYPREECALLPVLNRFGVKHRNFILCVGTLEPRKNLQLALRAFAQLPEHVRANTPLLVAGMSGWNLEETAPFIKKAVAQGQVRLLGYVPDDILAHLVAGASFLLFPSLYEGFGLPVVEAMASGTPVVLTASSALPEVAGTAGVYIDEHDESIGSAAMARLIDDHAFWAAQSAVGMSQAENFSWTRCATITAQAYREAAAS